MPFSNFLSDGDTAVRSHCVLLNVVLLGILGAIVYSVVQTIRGEYAEIPTLSEAVYMQVR